MSLEQTAASPERARNVPPWLFRLVPPRLYHRLRRLPVIGGLVRGAFDALLPRRGLVLVRVQGGPLTHMVLEVDPRTQIDVVVGRYERRVQGVVEVVLEPGAVAFDIGAHLGYFTLMMGMRVGREGRVVSFEPDPAVMEGLRRNVKRNGALAEAEILLVPAAVDETAGRARFTEGRETSRGKLVAAGGDLDVQVMMLDDVARQFGSPSLVKIDVEGREVGVLHGAGEVLAAGAATFVIEAHTDALERGCLEVLARFGYSSEVGSEPGRAESYIVARPPARRT